MFGLELEGMSHEDQEFEVARRVVNLGVEAAKTAAQGAAAGPPTRVAKDALMIAARAHAPDWPAPPRPGSVVTLPQGPAREAVPRAAGRSGRWYRRRPPDHHPGSVSRGGPLSAHCTSDARPEPCSCGSDD